MILRSRIKTDKTLSKYFYNSIPLELYIRPAPFKFSVDMRHATSVHSYGDILTFVYGYMFEIMT